MDMLVSVDNRIDLSTTTRVLSEQESESARNAVSRSPLSRIALLPNHNIGPDGQLRGYFFSCHASDSAAVLPMHAQMFETTAVYCVSDRSKAQHGGFDERALWLAQNTLFAHEKLRAVAAELAGLETADFSCMPTSNADDETSGRWQDARAWSPDVPLRMGVYHAFSRSHVVDRREHRVYLVITGSLRRCADALYNMWEDVKDAVTCREFMECEEVLWMRRAT